MTCALCEIRRPRRYCLGVRGQICAPCCGVEREVTVNCPFECEYLQQARLHERMPDLKEQDLPNRDIEVTESFIQEHEALASLSSRFLLEASVAVPGVSDADVREALETLIRTFRTLESGIYYESRPNNPLAAAVHQGFQARLSQARQEMARQSGVNTIRDTAILGVLALLQRMALNFVNGRSHGRAYLHFLHDRFSDQPVPVDALPPAAGGSSLIVP
ncbi:MAG: hypothetical protein Q8N47_18020 [Bryobacterales bacterium]|nr:hypothetical protein [Bryobacterales bacterium]